MNKFLTSNEWQWRLARTIVQAVIGFVIANLDIILGSFSLDPTMKTLIVGLVMAILSPIMAELGKGDDYLEIEATGFDLDLDEKNEK